MLYEVITNRLAAWQRKGCLADHNMGISDTQLVQPLSQVIRQLDAGDGADLNAVDRRRAAGRLLYEYADLQLFLDLV